MTAEGYNTTTEPSGWAIGWTFFAAMMMILIGTFHIVAGLTGIINDDFYRFTDDYIVKFDTTGWGWIHLVIGVIVLLSGVYLFTGNVLARTVGVIMAALSVLAGFGFIPLYPVWGIVIVAMGVSVIWALTAHGRDISAA